MREKAMKKETDMLKEYDFSKGVRGKYAKRYKAGTNIVLLSKDLAHLFPDSKSVNDALRVLTNVALRKIKKAA